VPTANQNLIQDILNEALLPQFNKKPLLKKSVALEIIPEKAA
jgi:hypothetical protein